LYYLNAKRVKAGRKKFFDGKIKISKSNIKKYKIKFPRTSERFNYKFLKGKITN